MSRAANSGRPALIDADMYRGLFARSPRAIIVADRDGWIATANRAALSTLGYQMEALRHRQLHDLLIPSPGRALTAAGQDGRHGEVDLRAADGTTVAAEVDVVDLPTADGDLCAWFLHPRLNPRVEHEPNDPDELTYRSLLEHLPGVVYRLADDANQTALYLSPRLAELTGYTSAEALAQADAWHWLDHIHPDDRARIAAKDGVGESDESVRLEYRLRRADGSYVWVQDDCVPVRDETGQIVAWQGVLLDISDRIQAEEDRARLAAIVESSEDAIISRSLDGVITSWNRGAERLYGFRADEAIGQSITMLLADDDDSDPLVPIERLGDEPVPFEATRQRKDGSVIDVAISISPIRDRNDIVVGVSSITRDITERKRADEELRAALDEARAATRAKTLFLAMMSHELRTPLQAVLGYADFLLADPSGSLSPQQTEDIGFIQQGARRMVTLIDQMLDLSRMEAGRLELETERVDLAEIIEQVRQDIAPQAATKGLALDISVPGALPAAWGDSIRIRQILLNLAGNAVKFTERGDIRIDARATTQGNAVAVSDSGIGIAPAAVPHIFEEFRQVDSRTTRRYGGAGLGLAISRRLAEEMGGSISVESVPGAGSTFTLHLPSADRVRRRKARSTRQGTTTTRA